ncbi:MAG: family 20 glycosylhydrolase, partial [Alistipes sp.]|nr:family 20 glycosylhydrolase [Alistipes sp.]
MVEYAAVRNIEIIPEIDLPGHSHNLARVKPEVLCNYTPDKTATDGYDSRSVLCVAKEENYALLDDVIRELSELFPSEYIHVGGDEVSTAQWSRCPDCQALMRREGMTQERQLQDYFTRRMERIAAKYGKRIGVWNEAAESGDIDRSALVYGWESKAACKDVLDKGYRTVVMPGEYFYFDMRQSSREEGHDWAAIFDVRKPLSFGFEEFTAEQMARVAGVQASFFSEAYISRLEYDYDFLYYQTYPRICALSEVAWRGQGDEWEAFYNRLTTAHYSRMEAMGIDFRMMPPTVQYKDGVLTATTDDRSQIYYTEVGTEGEKLYTAPISTDKPQRFAFRTRRAGARSPEAAVAGHWRKLQPKVKITSSIAESERFPYSNAEGYGRIARTSRVGKEGDWILYTFDEAVECRRMEIATGNLQLPRYIFTAGYMELSYDGEHFERVGDLKGGGAVIENPRRAIKAVRLVCTQSGNGESFVTVQEPKVYPIL